MTSRFRRVGVLFALASAAGCTAGTPDQAAAPDPAKITVFFPLNGVIVHGRGSPGVLTDPEVTSVYVASHPVGIHAVVPLDRDGAFNFSLAAGSNDVLEFAAALDPEGNARGAATFVRVPVKQKEGEDYVCCLRAGATRGKCQLESSEVVCEDSILAAECGDNGDCAALSGQVISIAEDTFEIEPPNENGQIKVTSKPGLLPPLRMVTVENRGLRAVGGADRNYREAAITNENGVVEMVFSARGDDELVFRVYQQDGFFRSREHSVFVPDSQLTGLDVIGVYPFAPLKNNERGTLAVRFSPFGRDGLGICDDSDENPALCFSAGRSRANNFNGGLDHGRIEFTRFVFDGQYSPVGGVQATAPNAVLINNKFTDGDVLAGPQLVTLLLDNSAKANEVDPARLRFRAAESFAGSLRSRDRLMIVSLGSNQGFRMENDIGTAGAQSREALVTIVQRLEQEAPSGEADIFGALKAAAQKMRDFSSVPRGRILVVTTAPPSGDETSDTAFVQAFDAIAPDDPSHQKQSFSTFVVMTPQGGNKLASQLATLAEFSDEHSSFGMVTEIPNADGFLTATADAAGRISGAFVLLFDVTIPCNVGKAAKIEIEARLRATARDGSDISRTGVFTGYLEIRDAQQSNCQ